MMNSIKNILFYYIYIFSTPSRLLTDKLTYWTNCGDMKSIQKLIAISMAITTVGMLICLVILSFIVNSNLLSNSEKVSWLIAATIFSYFFQILSNAGISPALVSKSEAHKSQIQMFYILPMFVNAATGLAIVVATNKLSSSGSLSDIWYYLSLVFYGPYILTLPLLLMTKSQESFMCCVSVLSYLRPLTRQSPAIDNGLTLQTDIVNALTSISTQNTWSLERYISAKRTAMLSTYRTTDILIGGSPDSNVGDQSRFLKNVRDVMSACTTDKRFARNTMLSAMKHGQIHLAVELFDSNNLKPKLWMCERDKKWLTILNSDDKNRAECAGNEIKQSVNLLKNHDNLRALTHEIMHKYKASPIRTLSHVPSECQPFVLEKLA